MKKNELLSALRSLQNNKNRTALAVTVGVMAMLLLLLSELLPSGNTQKTAASTVRTAAVSQYQTQLEQQLEELISQLQGAGRTTVMVTLTTGEETIYAVDTQTGDLQQQETHVLLQDGSALAETTYLPQVCGVAVLCEGGGDVRVAARITELLHSLLDVGILSHHHQPAGPLVQPVHRPVHKLLRPVKIGKHPIFKRLPALTRGHRGQPLRRHPR